jgi:hypothetical protein
MIAILNKIELPEQASPASPSAGEIILYVGTDGNLYAKDSTGTIYKIN